jgi:hypothetical protein
LEHILPILFGKAAEKDRLAACAPQISFSIEHRSVTNGGLETAAPWIYRK